MTGRSTPSTLNEADWRALTEDSPAAPTSEPASPPPATRRLYTRSRRGNAAREQDRARAIVTQAKDVVTGAFDDIRSGRRITTADLEPVVEAIAASVSRSAIALPTVTRLKQVHEYTYLHSVAVCALMIGLARELRLDDALTFQIGLSGLLHDIGKACVPTALLDKPGPLDLDEYKVVQQHTTRGRDLLEQCGILDEMVLDVCLHHHERVDGRGYPIGLARPDLSIFARMAAVCDVYDAVTSKRAYKESWSPGAAFDWMMRTEGQFDPQVLRAFRRIVGTFPVGSLVMLQSQRLGIILRGDTGNAHESDVGLLLCGHTQRPLERQRLSTADDPVLTIEDPTRWGFQRWTEQSSELMRMFD